MGRYSLLGAIEEFVIGKEQIRREVVTDGRILSISAGGRALVSVDGLEVDLAMANDTPYKVGQRVVIGKDEQGKGYIIGEL